MEVGVLQNMLASQELVSNAVSKVTGPESAQLRLLIVPYQRVMNEDVTIRVPTLHPGMSVREGRLNTRPADIICLRGRPDTLRDTLLPETTEIIGHRGLLHHLAVIGNIPLLLDPRGNMRTIVCVHHLLCHPLATTAVHHFTLRL